MHQLLVGSFASIFLAILPVIALRQAVGQLPDEGVKPADRVPEALEKLFRGIDEASLRESPKRSFKFATGDKQQIRILMNDPKIRENKFVASVRLMGTRHIARIGQSPSVLDLENRLIYELKGDAVKRTLAPTGNSLFTGHSRHSGRGLKNAVRDYFSDLVLLCPRDELPAKELVEYLTSASADRDIKWTFDSTQGGYDWIVEVFAPTEDGAKQRVSAIIRLLDCATCRPLQRDCLAEGQKSLAAVRMGYEQLAKHDETIRVEEAKAVQVPEITADILSELKSQKVMVSIELATVSARVIACNEMLKAIGNREPRTASGQFETINDIKIKAEIDLAGIKAKLERINGFIGEANDSNALRMQIMQIKGTREQSLRQIQLDKQRAEDFARIISLFAPLDIKYNEITISPVEWTN